MKKQSPIEQFVRIIGEENFHIFHAEYLLYGNKESVKSFINRLKTDSVDWAFVWRESLNGYKFWRKLHQKLIREWRFEI